jgi:hypothetical protein
MSDPSILLSCQGRDASSRPPESTPRTFLYNVGRGFCVLALPSHTLSILRSGCCATSTCSTSQATACKEKSPWCSLASVSRGMGEGRGFGAADARRRYFLGQGWFARAARFPGRGHVVTVDVYVTSLQSSSRLPEQSTWYTVRFGATK